MRLGIGREGHSDRVRDRDRDRVRYRDRDRVRNKDKEDMKETARRALHLSLQLKVGAPGKREKNI